MLVVNINSLSRAQAQLLYPTHRRFQNDDALWLSLIEGIHYLSSICSCFLSSPQHVQVRDETFIPRDNIDPKAQEQRHHMCWSQGLQLKKASKVTSRIIMSCRLAQSTLVMLLIVPNSSVVINHPTRFGQSQSLGHCPSESSRMGCRLLSSMDLANHCGVLRCIF